jgi:PAS domain S-box-containing protein
VAQREQAEALIRLSEQRLAEAQHLARLGSWHWDVATDRVTWSEALYVIYGLPPDQFAGTYESFLERVYPDDQDQVRSILAQAFKDHHAFSFDHRILRPDGGIRTLHARGQVVTDDAGHLVAMRGTGQDITERKAIEDELRASRAQLIQEIAERRRVQQQLEQWREAERVRIAREVHDGLGGALTGLKMGLSRVRKIEALPLEAHDRLLELARDVDATTQLVRHIAQELRPAVLDDFGLLAALEWQFKEFQSRSGLAGELRAEVEALPLPPEAAIACFRIVQEALTNVARHAQASRVDMLIELQADQITIQVVDNGRGLPVGEPATYGHLGLVGMRERASLLGGELQMLSAPGRGTQVILRVPTRQR